MKRVVVTCALATALAVAPALPARSAPRLELVGCSDAALVVPVSPEQVRGEVPPSYGLATVGTEAFLYVNTTICPDGTTFHIVSVGVTPPDGSAAAPAPIGPGRRDHYILSLSTSSPTLLSLLRRHGLPAARTDIAFEETPGTVTTRTVVAVRQTGFLLDGSFTRQGSPTHNHEHHWWHGDAADAAELRLDITMIDHPGVARFNAHRHSAIARSGADGGDTAAFLNRNDIVLTIRG